jgi:hypothetical protein
MRAFAYRIVVKKAQSRKLMVCPTVSRVACCERLKPVGRQDEWRKAYASYFVLNAVCKGEGGQFPAPEVPVYQELLAAKKNRIPGAGFPRCKAPGRRHALPPGRCAERCSVSAGRRSPGVSQTLVTSSLLPALARPRELQGWHLAMENSPSSGMPCSRMSAGVSGPIGRVA